MKMNNNNIRAAKRHLCGLWKGANGISYRDFSGILEAFVEDDMERQNRTHEKSENSANDKESD